MTATATVQDEAPVVTTGETPEIPAEERRGGAPSRSYVVLEEIELDGTDEGAYQRVTTVEARNGQNALRKAFKDLRSQRGEAFDAATLVVIPEGQWKPTPVRAERRETISVAVGS